MKRHLLKRKNANLIDFIEVPVKIGRCHKEFWGFDLKLNRFFMIFFDNKYRQDSFNPSNDFLMELKKERGESVKDSFGRGIFNLDEEIETYDRQITFLEKYKNNLK